MRVMANGPDGLAISDSRSRISGAVILPDGIRLPATSAWKRVSDWEGSKRSTPTRRMCCQNWHVRRGQATECRHWTTVEWLRAENCWVVTIFSNWSFALHTDLHATSMVDCGTEGESLLSSEEISTPTTPNYPQSIGWKHDKGRSGAAESQDGCRHFGSRQKPWTRESS